MVSKPENLHGRSSIGIRKGSPAKTMLKDESLQRQRVDEMEILCWHRMPPRFDKGRSNLCLSLGGSSWTEL